MQHECRITVLETKCFPEYQRQYLADPKSGSCLYIETEDTFRRQVNSAARCFCLSL